MGKSIAVAYTMKKKSKHKQEKGINPKSYEKGVSEAGRSVRESREGDKEHMYKKNEKAKMEHDSVLEELKEMPGPTKGKSGFASGGTVKSGDPTMNYAEGGTVEETPSQAGAGPYSKMEEMVDCPHCKKSFSHGGMVANAQGPGVDGLPNEFDDLALRDKLEFKYTGANSGDLVGRAMAKKKAKR